MPGGHYRRSHLVRPEFRREHGITTPWTDLAAWIRAEADLASFDGTMDLAGHGWGFFKDVMDPPTAAEKAAGTEAAYDWLLASIPIEAQA